MFEQQSVNAVIFLVITYTGCNVVDIHFTFTRDGRPSGEAYIELETDQDVNVALSKNQQHMGKRYIEGTVAVCH